ncbi:hypothetical protein IFR05_001532 [Cadophora sp. M221]|nr:hypothetical protein IFR05_001532 [Cadophora sp. M221]
MPRRSDIYVATLSDILVIIFGIVATIVGIGAILATLYSRGHRIHFGDLERQAVLNSTSSTQSADATIRLIELLPDIIHGRNPTRANGIHRIENGAHGRTD